MIRLRNIPETLFCKVRLVNDLYSIMILNRVKRHMSGREPDVRVRSVLGGEELISRRDLLKNYRQVNGKKLKMILLKEEKVLWVKGNRSGLLYALKVPNNGVQCKGGVVPPGKWVICRADEEGHVDYSCFIAMDDKYFRKMFTIVEIPFREELIERSRRISEGEDIGEPLTKRNNSIDDSIARGYSDGIAEDREYEEVHNREVVIAKQEKKIKWRVIARKRTSHGMLYRIESENKDRLEVTQEKLDSMIKSGSIALRS